MFPQSVRHFRRVMDNPESCPQVVLRYFVCEPLATIVIFPSSDFLEMITVVKASVFPTLSAHPSISSQSPVVAVDM